MDLCWVLLMYLLLCSIISSHVIVDLAMYASVSSKTVYPAAIYPVQASEMT